MTHRDEIAIRSLRQATEKHGIEPTSAMKSAFGGMEYKKVVGLDDWRNKFYSLADLEGTQDTKRKAFQRTRQKLLEHKKIVTMDGYFWEIFSDK